MAAILDLCVKMMFKHQNDVIVINLVVDLSKRGYSHMTQCVLLQKLSFKLFFKLVRAAILDLALRRKIQDFWEAPVTYFFPKRFLEVESVIKTC